MVALKIFGDFCVSKLVHVISSGRRVDNRIRTYCPGSFSVSIPIAEQSTPLGSQASVCSPASSPCDRRCNYSIPPDKGGWLQARNWSVMKPSMMMTIFNPQLGASPYGCHHFTASEQRMMSAGEWSPVYLDMASLSTWYLCSSLAMAQPAAGTYACFERYAGEESHPQGGGGGVFAMPSSPKLTMLVPSL